MYFSGTAVTGTPVIDINSFTIKVVTRVIFYQVSHYTFKNTKFMAGAEDENTHSSKYSIK
jgi:hypothetical protein